jgi:uncharacterized protein
MQCPKCNSAMERIEFGTDIEVMRCTGCQGLYCERPMLARMRDEWLAETVLDTGSVAVGARNNEIQDIPCPGCRTIMVRIEDDEQSHIVLDACPSCEGVFLDAGELTDMKTVTLMDKVRKLLSRL